MSSKLFTYWLWNNGQPSAGQTTSLQCSKSLVQVIFPVINTVLIQVHTWEHKHWYRYIYHRPISASWLLSSHSYRSATHLLINGRHSAQFILSDSEPDSITWERTPDPNPDSHWTRRLLRRATPAETVRAHLKAAHRWND